MGCVGASRARRSAPHACLAVITDWAFCWVAGGRPLTRVRLAEDRALTRLSRCAASERMRGVGGGVVLLRWDRSGKAGYCDAGSDLFVGGGGGRLLMGAGGVGVGLAGVVVCADGGGAGCDVGGDWQQRVV